MPKKISPLATARRDRDRLAAQITSLEKTIVQKQREVEAHRRYEARGQKAWVALAKRKQQYVQRLAKLETKLREPARQAAVARLPRDVLMCLRAIRDLKIMPPDQPWRFTSAVLVIAEEARRILAAEPAEGLSDE